MVSLNTRLPRRVEFLEGCHNSDPSPNWGFDTLHELYWELDVKSDESGRDTHERRRIETVSPS